jgi:predicted transcriptional regulator
MLQLSPTRKNKINLSDYDAEQDIRNRMLMADFSPQDLGVVEEILFSPLKISTKKLARAVNMQESEIAPILKRLVSAGLIQTEGDTIFVDKERRKYFEFQIQRFDPHFKPDMEFAQGLLRQVPIHVLPSWYALPRSSNNIFESIIEKYLLSPQIYQRYLQELNFGDARIHNILNDVLHSPDLRVHSSDLIAKYNLSRAEFEEIMLLLEFNFACCISYLREDDHWLEVATPFQEWGQYLRFLRTTESPPISKAETIVRLRPSDFGFIEDATALLKRLHKRPAPYSEVVSFLASLCAKEMETPAVERYVSHLIAKLTQLRLIERSSDTLSSSAAASEFPDMSLENRALFLYRSSHNCLLSAPHLQHAATERNIREAEKAIRRVLHGKWVYMDDFLRGVQVALSENSVVMLRKVGKQWSYNIPQYTEIEKELIRATISELLFEAGIVALGTHQGRACFAVTAFGRFFFEE